MKLKISMIRLAALIGPLFSISCMQASLEPLAVSAAPESLSAPTVPTPQKNIPKFNSAPISQEEEDFEVVETRPPVPKQTATSSPAKGAPSSATKPSLTIEDIIAQSEAETNPPPKPAGAALPTPRPGSLPLPTAKPSGSKPEVPSSPAPTPAATPVATPAATPKVIPMPQTRPKDLVTVDQAKADMTGPGVLKPSVYYFTLSNEDALKCTKDTWLKGTGGKNLLKVCKRTADACSLQGSCAVIQNRVTHAFNIIGKENGEDRFFEIDEEKCRFGYGVRSSCLDPFYTLAADLELYEPGEVIFIPKVVGLVLPDGSVHSGYFVIRDRGHGIKGTGRFDFFSGTMSWRDADNPFRKLGLGDTRTSMPYYRVGGKTAQQVLKNRAFPKLPSHAVEVE